MGSGREKLDEVVAKLREERDELRVRIHLGTMEAKQEWEELEKKWQRFESRVGQAKDEAVEKSREVGESVDIVADEIKSAYRRIRERLAEE